MKQKEEMKARILGKLSINIGSNKKGDIVVREGENLNQLARNFVASYGLKKEFIAIIKTSLDQLVQKYSKKGVKDDRESDDSLLEKPLDSSNSFEE